MTVNLEKIFFAYIIKNKKHFEAVKPNFFKNPDIEFVYRIVRSYMLKHTDSDVPSNKQIVEMVRLEDKEKSITKEMLVSILKMNLGEYDEEKFIKPRFKAWVISNRIKDGTSEIIDKSRGLENQTELLEIIGVADTIRTIAEDATNSDFDLDDEDLGSDFDDAEEHAQDHSAIKVKTGYDCLDHILGGGWDVSTLNMIMGETNAGKSLWMQNFAIHSANQGYNVLYITLEMSVKKCLKRMGSMRLKIPINDYDNVSNNTEFINDRIKNLHNSSGDGVLSSKKLGKIITKFYAAGTATTQDFDNLIQRIWEKKRIQIDMVVVDYISLIAPPRGMGFENNLYLKGKHLAEGLRAIAAKHECPVITGIQVSKDAWNNNDITLDKIPESKAIAETADTFFAIIRTEEMKRQNIYRLKLLKQRDGDFSRSQVKFDLNTKFLTIENDVFVDSI